MTVRPDILALKDRMQKDIIGQSDILDKLLIGLLSNGNLLVEGLPGLAKTRAIKALSNNLEGDFNRIQFTPDLVSADITGKNVYDEFGKSHFEPGPIFANFVLADEINRAPPKSQNALLEAMEERQVTASGQTLKMPNLFLVMATMNPSTQQGTFPMPEAQKDRFLMHVNVEYPDEEAEGKIIRLVRNEQSQNQKTKQNIEQTVTPQDIIFSARAEIDDVTVPEGVEKYMVDLIFATRYPQKYTYEIHNFIKEGASPMHQLDWIKSSVLTLGCMSATRSI